MTANRAGARTTISVLAGLTAVLLVSALVAAFIIAPPEMEMGDVQRIFYFHVSAAWTAFLAFFVVLVASILYLRTRLIKWDILATSAAEIGVVFTTVTLLSGSVWARSAWGTWWTWEPRLTTATIVELVYAAYLMLRQGIEDPDRRARFGAVYTILGFISVPVTFLSIRLYRTIHPTVFGVSSPEAEGEFSMTPSMLQTLIFSVLTFSVIFSSLLWHRIRLGRLAEKVEQLRLKIAH